MFFSAFKLGSKAPSREEKKEKLLDALSGLRRGLTATEDDARLVEGLAADMERVNPTKKPLAAADLLSGRWELLYTTSASILGKSRPAFLRPGGPIYQTLDVTALTARNQESWPLFNQVFAELEPLSDSMVKVQFKEFKLLGLIPVKAPARAVGKLDVTYLDDDLRISRGDKGNLFILKMDDRSIKP